MKRGRSFRGSLVLAVCAGLLGCKKGTDAPTTPVAAAPAAAPSTKDPNRPGELGKNVIRGKVTYEAVCEAHDMPYTPLDAALAA